MSKNKNLLQEGTVRRFMKLAGTQAIASDFLQETYYQRDEPEEGPEGELDLGAEVDVEAEPAVEELPAEPEGLDLEEPEEDEGEEGPEDEGSVEAALRDVLDAIQGVASEHGVDMEVEELPEPDEIEVGELEDTGEEEALAVPEEGEETGEVTPPDEEEGPLAEINYVDEGALMETVYKRVAARLSKEKKADDMASVLAEKISKRLNRV